MGSKIYSMIILSLLLSLVFANERQFFDDLYRNFPKLQDLSAWPYTNSYCHAYGITCDSYGHVGKFIIYDLELNGVLPDSISHLTEIKELTIHNCSVQVNLNSISSLPKLKKLVLSYNKLSGPIPILSKSLIYLSLIGNSFTLLPPYFPPRIITLRLANNSFSANITEASQLFNLSCLQILSISHNNFSGNLFDSVGHLRYLRQIVANNNQLSGTLPYFDQTYQLSYLDISHNAFTGKLKSLFDLNLVYINLENNLFTGNLPDTISKTSLVHINLSKNCLTGSIPEFKSNRLLSLNLSGNQLTINCDDEKKFTSTRLKYGQCELADNYSNGDCVFEYCSFTKRLTPS
ncbi:uncharacterized protein LOC126319884 [Schistocerca gregaria]|uniref:uncharacterized protein LOC126319884 n=1 Tax=Schistocerca gregaria TaxID=7010 RepID=UPI00211EC045|nr:uncharacterized protein LOC126319884 [Schistocerca gregaria]